MTGKQCRAALRPMATIWFRVGAGLGASCVSITAVTAQPVIATHDGITTATFVEESAQFHSKSAASIDFVNAQPWNLPIAYNYSESVAQSDLIGALSSTAIPRKPGFSQGSPGDGKTNPVFLGKPAAFGAGAEPQAFGTSNQPFSTERADGFSGSTNQIYPFRAAGKLFFNEGSSTFI